MNRLAVGKCLLLCMACAMSFAATARVVRVADVEALYIAVNDPGNAGATIALSRGSYPLTANDPLGVPRPKGGRIELQPDMSLVGVAGDRSAVVIDAFDLPASSFPQTTGPNAAVRMGLGYNALAWLTVRDARFAQANIDSGLQPLDPGTAFVVIEHVASTGSTRGLHILNFGPQSSGQTIELFIIDSQFFDNDLNLAQGIRIGNFQGATGSTINAWMLGNIAWGQQTGALIVNNRALQSAISVYSVGNRFHGNGLGMGVFGGLSSNEMRADGNTIHFRGFGDRYYDNTGATVFDHGGLAVLGIENTSTQAGGGSNNTVHVELWACRLQGNTNADLTGIGARSVPESTAGLSQYNQVTIEIRGERRGATPVEFFANSVPALPDFGNTVSVIR